MLLASVYALVVWKIVAPEPGFATGSKLMLSKRFSTSKRTSMFRVPPSPNFLVMPKSTRENHGALITSSRGAQSPERICRHVALLAGAFPGVRNMTKGGCLVSASCTVTQETAGAYVWNNQWGNLGAGGSELAIYEGIIKMGRDVFTVAKPGYTPYVYPHPLNVPDAQGQGIAAPSKLRIVNP